MFMITNERSQLSLWLAMSLAVFSNVDAQVATARQEPAAKVSPDGVISVPAFELPLSPALSSEAKRYMTGILIDPPISPPATNAIQTEQQYRAYVDDYRATMNSMFEPFEKDVLKAYPATVKAETIDGVPVEAFTPKAGVSEANRNRVLINLHGGGFFAGADHVGRIESAPIAEIGKIRVVSINYRQGYEHRFPAASEDVEKVYRVLLKQYPARNIGIYGCSAGGALAAQATSWILDKGLPTPGAIGMFSSGASGMGDGLYLAALSMAQPIPPASVASTAALGTRAAAKFGYFAGAPDNHLTDIRKAPKDFVAKFPPTLLITGTRSFDLSPVLLTHRTLTQAGVDASLQVFDGLPHCFIYQHYLPETRDANDTIVRFFDRHLGR
jgi:epsilon-lactone hydrolase